VLLSLQALGSERGLLGAGSWEQQQLLWVLGVCCSHCCSLLYGWEEGEAAVMPEVNGVEDAAAAVDDDNADAAADSDEFDEQLLARVSSVVTRLASGHLFRLNSYREALPAAASAAFASVLPRLMSAVTVS
jgi:hypothetical protein